MILEKVRRTIEAYGMLNKGDTVVVAVSGGPDSTALLNLLFSLEKEFPLSLHLAHLNHMFRGKEAEKDALYVKRLARKFGLPVTVGKRNVPALIKSRKLSPEEGARQARYEFLQKVAGKVNAGKIAVGSTADDQAETVLMKMLRGSGLKGLTGIAPMRPLTPSELFQPPEDNALNLKPSTFNFQPYIIRPLLEVSRLEIEEYLKKTGLRPRVDASNRDMVYLRNRIRQELLPHLAENYNPHIKSLLSGMARVLQADEEYLTGITEKIFSRTAKVEKNQQVIVDMKRLKRFHLSIQRRVLRKGIESVKGDLRGISLTQLDDILKIVNSPGGLEIHLPEDVVARYRYGDLVIFKKGQRKKRVPGGPLAPGGVGLTVPGETEVGELKIRIRCSLLPREKVRLPEKDSFLPGVAYFDFAKIKLPLLIRNRKRGDSFRPLGMRGRKKLKDFFIDRKIPREEREEIPLLVQGKDILWVVGHRQGEEAKVTGKTKEVLRVEIVPG
ncbi:MAG: tRNA lysidine(34) synthetase TilS [Nitrospirae bacterium]|nr:tRNA lysidine(34) synthetase TilS [Nitrospirota bacterium]